MQEIKISGHDQTCAHWVQELEYTGYEEYESGYESAESLQTEQDVFHDYLMAWSTTALIFANISSGGSIFPYSSEQSTLMNLGSISHCF